VRRSWGVKAARLTYPNIGSVGIACAAVEGLTRALAAELCPVDVVDVRAHGTLLGRVPTLAEVANVAARMASDLASPLTANVVNVACGEIAD
jgi:3-oxoacyl-[acyl-carrier protein] reductase